MSTHAMRLIATRQENDIVLVKALIRHANHNGLGRTESGEPISPHHLVEIVVTRNDEPVVTIYTGSGIAADPLFGWRIVANSGDRISVSWRDSLAMNGRAETVLA
ncbi:MAG: thiosulfate oxidation carrier complex protein SoxZ [Rhodospirillaceae bacterium]|nr:thiosulfate oxidation carrier complex protein SoxZ [Rhodospirillales bacterium]